MKRKHESAKKKSKYSAKAVTLVKKVIMMYEKGEAEIRDREMAARCQKERKS